MLDMYIIVISLIIILFSWLLLYRYYSTKAKNTLQTFVDSQSHIVIIGTSKSMRIINKKGLDFFGFKSLNSMTTSNTNLVDFFIEEWECIDKYTYGQNWIEGVLSDKKVKHNMIKVKIFSKEDTLDHYFHIKISKMLHSNEYILSFFDISDMEKDLLSIKKTAELDPLTKAYNRVKLNDIFEPLFYNSKKFDSDLTMILLDIDHFKKINDEYGHDVGDKVLKELSGLIRTLLRKDDIFARWGGEEFVVLLQNTTLKKSTEMASRLRAEIEKYSFEEVRDVTCSFGVTQFKQGDTESLFFKRVDNALYEAKENGRNRVVTK